MWVTSIAMNRKRKRVLSPKRPPAFECNMTDCQNLIAEAKSLFSESLLVSLIFSKDRLENDICRFACCCIDRWFGSYENLSLGCFELLVLLFQLATDVSRGTLMDNAANELFKTHKRSSKLMDLIQRNKRREKFV